jgi:hypothetical protein
MRSREPGLPALGRVLGAGTLGHGQLRTFLEHASSHRLGVFFSIAAYTGGDAESYWRWADAMSTSRRERSRFPAQSTCSTA